jgi:hypothetical protein
VARSTAKNPGGRRKKSSGKPVVEPRDEIAPSNSTLEMTGAEGDVKAAPSRKNGGWREIEALREKAALKASLADVWDEDFDLDEEILAELDHTAEFFTTQEEPEDEIFDDVDEGIDEYFEDDED